MHSRQVFFAIGLLTAVAAPSTALLALEAATSTIDRASNAAVARHVAAQRADQLAHVASLDFQAMSIITCSGKGKFYTPSKTGADNDGCTVIEVTVNE